MKVSGDLIKNEEFYKFLSSLKGSKLVIIPGGAGAITEVLNARNIPFEYTSLGRKIESEEGRRLAWEILLENKIIIENILKRNLPEFIKVVYI